MLEMHGPFSSYFANGKMENQGSYVNGREDGVWQNWDSTEKKIDSVVYKDGLILLSRLYDYDEKGKLNYYSIS